MGFVNPYSFVSLPDDIDRQRPAGHAARSEQLLAGSIAVTWRATTPVSVSTEEAHAAAVRPSSVHGALRSFHEAMAGGCMRVFDADALPVYREPVEVVQSRTMAVVKRVDEKGIWLSQPVAATPVKVRDLLEAGNAEEIRTGARFDLQEIGERRHLVTFSEDGTHRLLVTDGSARPQINSGWAFWTVEEVDADWLEVTDDVLWEFLESLRGADDLRTARQAELRTTYRDGFEPVRRPTDGGPVVGYRRYLRAGVFPVVVGQPVFVETSRTERGSVISAVRLSAISRRVGKFAAGERIPPALAACEDPEDLCISCRLFGSAAPAIRRTKAIHGKPSRALRFDTDHPARSFDIATAAEDDERAAAQSSYRGQVIVHSCVTQSAGDLLQLTLPRTDAPRPGAGQFYLDNSSTPVGPDTPWEQIPDRGRAERAGREWGSALDTRPKKPRQLRGRKFYWTRSALASQVGPPRPSDEGETLTRYALPSDSMISLTLTFENLTAMELGSVICALDPGRWGASAGLDDPAGLRFRLGGGKNLGLGALITHKLQLQLEQAAARWLGEAASDHAVDVDEYVRDFVLSSTDAVKKGWMALSHLSAVDYVPPGDITYPPALANGDPDFDFWKESSGLRYETGRKGAHVKMVDPLLSLPDAADPSQSQVIDRAQAKPARHEGR